MEAPTQELVILNDVIKELDELQEDLKNGVSPFEVCDRMETQIKRLQSIGG